MGFKSPFVALKEGIAKTLAGDYDKKAVKEAIGQYTEESKVVVFSWTRYRITSFSVLMRRYLKVLQTDVC